MAVECVGLPFGELRNEDAFPRKFRGCGTASNNISFRSELAERRSSRLWNLRTMDLMLAYDFPFHAQKSAD
jgi:hypothetical protein